MQALLALFIGNHLPTGRHFLPVIEIVFGASNNLANGCAHRHQRFMRTISAIDDIYRDFSDAIISFFRPHISVINNRTIILCDFRCESTA